ncbi:sterol desaturase family protein [Aquirufa aurantiipilula]|uniref:Sterol desaturase family protein n=1 Tax=Aquirufa aurantiipilula TaxID=2696561 RepID=A0ABT6BH48_9BACT|nr:sterol desaturase family protein [Aquirufa aurantiipilula]MDF5689620.1 sterol desaturase family protein [Aquirufa aurantiipilula]
MEILLWLGTFLFMEGMAWFTHKYIMHGIMWNWHESHHVHHKNVLEKNDLFSVVFGVMSTLTIIIGAEMEAYRPLLWIGLGIATYGLCYFIFHDIIVHRRIKIKFKTKNTYLKRLIKAHYVHHEVHEKEGAEAFGFLYAPKKYE